MPPPETCYTAESLFLVSLYLHPGMPFLLSDTQLNYHLLCFPWSELLYPLNIHSRLLGPVWHIFSIAFALFWIWRTLVVCPALLLNSELVIEGIMFVHLCIHPGPPLCGITQDVPSQCGGFTVCVTPNEGKWNWRPTEAEKRTEWTRYEWSLQKGGSFEALWRDSLK